MAGNHGPARDCSQDGAQDSALTGTLADALEGALLNPWMTARDARLHLVRWEELGIRRVVALPWILSQFDVASFPSIEFAGAVSFPTGCGTMTNKRVELLECVKLGARAASVVLTPGVILSADATSIEKEIVQLLSTASDLRVRLVVDLARVPDDALSVLIRILKDVRPSHIVTADGVFGEPCCAVRVSWLRARLTKKVRILAFAPVSDPTGARAYLDAGADILCTPHPERLFSVPSVGGAP